MRRGREGEVAALTFSGGRKGIQFIKLEKVQPQVKKKGRVHSTAAHRWMHKMLRTCGNCLLVVLIFLIRKHMEVKVWHQSYNLMKLTCS
jgi:hypothetical protein